ncbi:hypothetical protein [Hyphococcus luteus]|uniref:hypothetical protein n=1 Tax=Hyphococcus luteus TaxID=2058213 RepID=UPI0010575BF7|nr:hypothetical protein [Marinicaulis flavus]
MPKQNHFSGASLAEAVMNATAAYREENVLEAKSYCSDLRAEFDRKKIGFDHIHDRIVDMQREVNRLEDQARDVRNAALLSALIALGSALGSAARGLTKLRRLQLGKFTRRDLLDLAPFVGGALSAGANALSARSAFSEARRLEREIERLKAQHERLGDELLDLAKSYENSNCHLRPGVA